MAPLYVTWTDRTDREQYNACWINLVFVVDPLLVFIEYVPYGDLMGYLRKKDYVFANVGRVALIFEQT